LEAHVQRRKLETGKPSAQPHEAQVAAAVTCDDAPDLSICERVQLERKHGFKDVRRWSPDERTAYASDQHLLGRSSARASTHSADP
jgi:hypothetical protein